MGPWDPAPSEPEAPAPERRAARGRTRFLVIAAVIAVAAGLAWYLSKAEFRLREVTFSDDAVDVELVEPVPPSAGQAPVEVPPAPPPEPRPTLGPNGEVLRQPVWAKLPAPDFPTEAMRRGIDQGAVMLRCETLATGELGACEIISESPRGVGFAREALTSTRQARVRPPSIDGFETDGIIQFTVRFRLAP